MKHNPMLKYDDLILTYSDPEDGKMIIYAEKPSADGSDFDTFEVVYPEMEVRNVSGFHDEDIRQIIDQHISRLAPIAYDDAEETREA